MSARDAMRFICCCELYLEGGTYPSADQYKTMLRNQTSNLLESFYSMHIDYEESRLYNEGFNHQLYSAISRFAHHISQSLIIAFMRRFIYLLISAFVNPHPSAGSPHSSPSVRHIVPALPSLSSWGEDNCGS